MSAIAIPDGFYRVTAHVDPADADRIARSPAPGQTPQRRLETVLVGELERLGFSDTRLATEDPTDSSVWTFLTRARGTVGLFHSPGSPLHVVRLDPIEEPPRPKVARTRTLDAGLTEDELSAVRLAVERDPDPARLDGFADTLSSDFPIAAALVRAKALLEHAQRRLTPKIAALSGARPGRAPRVGARRLSHTSSRRRPVTYGASLVGALGEAHGSSVATLDLLERASEDLGRAAARTWERYAPTLETLIEMGAWDDDLLDPLRAPRSEHRPASTASNAAVHLLAATRGPESSLVSRPELLGPTLRGARSARPDAGLSWQEARMLATQVERARTQVDRQNWVRWFCASEAAGLI